MTAPKKPAKPKISPAVERAVASMLRDVMRDKEASLLDKMRVLDRALKLEAIKAKVVDDDEGSFFRGGGESDESTDERADDEAK